MTARNMGPNPVIPMPFPHRPSLLANKRNHSAPEGSPTKPSPPPKKTRRENLVPVDRVVVELGRSQQVAAILGAPEATREVKQEIVGAANDNKQAHQFDERMRMRNAGAPRNPPDEADVTAMSVTARQWIANRIEYSNAWQR